MTKKHHEKSHQEEAEQDVEMLPRESYEELQQKLDESEGKATDNWERLLRLQAEMDNLQRRAERDVSNAHKYALEKFAVALLPVVDSMERSLQTDQEESLVEGVKLTLTMLTGVLEKFGIQAVDPQSEAFNPELHQAVSVQPDPEAKPNTVLSVLQKGYLLNNRLIRPALVVVAQPS